MEKLDFKKDFLDYDWLKKENVKVRSQNNRTIMNLSGKRFQLKF